MHSLILGLVCTLTIPAAFVETPLQISPTREAEIGDTEASSYRIAVSPEGVVAIGSHRQVNVADGPDQKFRSYGGLIDTVKCIATGRKGTRVAACCGPDAVVWDVKTNQEIARYSLPAQHWYEGIHFHDDGESLYLLTHYNGVLLHWNYVKNEAKTLFKISESTTFPKEAQGRVPFASALRIIGDKAYIFRFPGIVEFDLTKKTERYLAFATPVIPRAIAVSADHKSMAFLTQTGKVAVYDVTTWKERVTIVFPPIHEVPGKVKKENPLFEEVRFTTNGKYLIVVGSMGNVRPSYLGIFRVSDGAFLGAFQTHPTRAESVGVTADDKLLITAAKDGIRFWALDDILKKIDKK